LAIHASLEEEKVRQRATTKSVRLPLLPSGPGGVCKPTIRGPWRNCYLTCASRGGKRN